VIKERTKMKGKFVTMKKRLKILELSLVQKRKRRNVLDLGTEKYGTESYKLTQTIY
jgi:hypothetical protein